jgi:hypothetical protein
VNEASVLAADAHRLAAMLVDEAHELLIALAEHHLHDVHCRFVGDAYAAMQARLHAHLLQQQIDAPSSTVHDNRIHADETQQRDVAGETILQHRIGHRLAAEPHDQRLCVITTNERQRFSQDPGFLPGGNDGMRHRVE